MMFTYAVTLLTLSLFVAMLLLMEVGRRIGLQRQAKDAGLSPVGFGAIDGAIFALLGLLIAFTFSGAASRFDTRRQLIVEETNAIGTAYLRLDLLPANARPALRENFRRYLDLRIAVYRKLPDIQAAKEELAKSTVLQNEIWAQAMAASTGASNAATMLVVPALNQMIDITTTRTMAAQMHPPITIFAMLVVLALLSALLAGFDMAAGKARSWIHMIGFAAILAITVYVILDIEYPRFGLIRIDAFDRALVELRQTMK